MPERWNLDRWTQNEDGSYTRTRGPDPGDEEVVGEVEATTAAEELALELGVDLSVVAGTGKDGKVTVADVRAAADE